MNTNTAISRRMKSCLYLSIFFLYSSQLLLAINPPVNPLTVDAGEDLIICAPGQTVTLSGSVIEPISGVSWDPAAGMSDPNSLTTDVYVTTRQLLLYQPMALEQRPI